MKNKVVFDTNILSRKIRNETIGLRKALNPRLPDSIIAATAVISKAILITNARKWFYISIYLSSNETIDFYHRHGMVTSPGVQIDGLFPYQYVPGPYLPPG